MSQHPQSVQRANPKPAAPEVANANTPPTIGNDLLRGAGEIARFVFGSVEHRRKVYYLTGAAKIRMPHFKIGSVLCARKSTLLAWIEAQEGLPHG
jgi:hypothetical protein